MSTRTEAQLAKNVLLHLGILAAEETPSAADSSYVIGRYEDALAELTEDNLAYWAADAIPQVIMEPLTQLIALMVSKPFGIMVSPADMEQGRMVYQRRIRRHTRQLSASVATQWEDF